MTLLFNETTGFNERAVATVWGGGVDTHPEKKLCFKNKAFLATEEYFVCKFCKLVDKQTIAGLFCRQIHHRHQRETPSSDGPGEDNIYVNRRLSHFCL